ncbi:MAG TPA: 4Fe-4S dicluster domain-containing protein, partial [Chitinivibrionales bacterium]
VKREPIRPVRGKGLLNFVKNALVPRPVITPKKCIKCGVCVGVCPVNPKALYWRGGNKNLPPAYHYKQCIRCLCCQELCPQSAVVVKVPLFRKMFMKPRTKRITQ